MGMHQERTLNLRHGFQMQILTYTQTPSTIASYMIHQNTRFPALQITMQSYLQAETQYNGLTKKIGTIYTIRSPLDGNHPT